jgi:hypothetical protein
MYAIAMGAGLSREGFKKILSERFGYESSKDVKKSQYDEVCKFLEAWRP